MSEAQKKRYENPEERRKISEAMKGKSTPKSEETRRKISEAHTGKALSDDHRKKLREG